MNTSEAIFDILKQYVDCVFFVPGGGAAYLVDALGRSGLRAVSMLHEQGAGFAAIGYAQIRNGLGVCLVTSGPGACNAVTPCAAAWVDSVPVLFISGQPRSDTLIGNSGLRTRGIQEIDIVPMVEHITKYAAQPLKGDMAQGLALAMIYDCLKERRGPCWLSVPLDVQMEEI
jgi:acetolactate synthase-1/2/3 large subunit